MKISCLRGMSFCEMWQLFSLTLLGNFLCCYYRWLKKYFALEKCKKECDIVLVILVQGFCPMKIKTTQFPDRLYRIIYLEGGDSLACLPPPTEIKMSTCNDRISVMITTQKNRGLWTA